MSLSTEALANRVMGSYPLSIPTSLALESINLGPNEPYDPEREIPNKIDLKKYEELWINLFSLYRNIVSSLPKENNSSVMPRDIKDTLQQEVDIIKDIIKHESEGKVKVIFYTSDYSGLNKEYPLASIRVDNTEKQKMYTAMLTNVINMFYKDNVASDELLHFSLKLKPKKASKALIITHFAYDLLSYDKFESLDLLESHTGLIKTRALWYTKFHNGKTLNRIPFNELFIQVFGDSQLFFPMDRKLREAVLEIAEKYEWSFATTNDRIRLGISEIKNHYFQTVLKDMI